MGVKVKKGEKWGGVENPDTSLVRRLKHSCQYRNTKTKKRRNSQTKTNKTESGQNKSKTKKGGREKVLKNLTRLWPGSSSTLTGNKRNKKHPTQEIKQDSTNEAAPKAVRE